jgi:hypothetical protein
MITEALIAIAEITATHYFVIRNLASQLSEEP